MKCSDLFGGISEGTGTAAEAGAGAEDAVGLEGSWESLPWPQGESASLRMSAAGRRGRRGGMLTGLSTPRSVPSRQLSGVVVFTSVQREFPGGRVPTAGAGLATLL